MNHESYKLTERESHLQFLYIFRVPTVALIEVAVIAINEINYQFHSFAFLMTLDIYHSEAPIFSRRSVDDLADLLTSRVAAYAEK